MKIIKNYIYNLSYQLLVLILPFVTIPYISRIFGPRGVGSYAVSYSIAHYFTVVGLLGINTYGARQIAYSRDNKEECDKTFWNLNYMRIITMSIVAVLYIVYVMFGVGIEKKALYIAQGFTLAASFFDVSWYFAGMEEFKITAVRNMLVKLVGVILVFIFIKTEEDVWLYALILSLSLLIGQLAVWNIIFRQIRFERPEKNRIAKYMKESFKLWIPAIAINIYASLDKVMLGYMIDDVEAGIYENTQKAIKMVSTVTTTFATVMTPRMSNLFHNRNIASIKENVYKSFKFVTFLAVPMVFGVIAVRKTFVPWFYGEEFGKISGLLIVSAWLVLTLSWSNVLGNQVLIACNKEKYYTLAVLTSAVINLLFNAILIPIITSYGAIIASVISEYVGMFIMMYCSRDVIRPLVLLKGIAHYFMAALIMFFISCYVGECMGATVIATFVQIVVGVLIYCFMMFLCKDEIMLKMIDIIRVNKEKQ